jgi:uncharacterized protein (DUF2147 family)
LQYLRCKKTSPMKKLTLLLCCCFLWVAAICQISQIKIINFQVKNVLPAKTDDWRAVPAALILTAQKPPGIEVKEPGMVLQIKSNGAVICGNTVSTAIAISPFEIKTFSSAELTGMLGNSSQLKEGSYQICVQFFNADRIAISNEVCKEFRVESTKADNYTAPVLINPENGKVFSADDMKRPLNFRWTPVVPRPKEPVTYRLKIWQLMQGQNGTAAMRSNQPIVTKEVDNINQAVISNLYTGPCKPPYLCDYVWQVQAVDKEGKGVGGNGGMSEVWSFGIGSVEANNGENNIPYTNTTGCPEIISPANGRTYSSSGNLAVKVSLPKDYKGNATLYKISKDRDFLNKPASENWKVNNRGIFQPNYRADSKALEFEPVTLELINRNGIGELALDNNLPEGSYTLVLNNPGCFPVASSFAISSAGCGTNNDLIRVSCKGWVNGLPTYTVSVTFSNIVPAAGGQQCITNMNGITSSTGTITGMTPVLPVIIPIGGNSPAVMFTYTPSSSSATSASFAYVGIWNDGNSNTSNFSNNNVPLPSCVCDACKTKIKFTPGPTSNTVSGNTWNIIQSITPAAPGLTIAAVKAEIISFQRYVGDSCIDCNKDATQWGNFMIGSLGTINGGFANANNGVTGNTHHSLYWQVPTGFTGPLTAFNLNMSIPALSNLTCCCDRIVTAIRYTYTFIDNNTKECVYCSIVMKYQQQKGNCRTVIEYNNDNPVKD